MTPVQKQALDLILALNESEFTSLALKRSSQQWSYLGSNSKNSGNDVFWMRFNNNSFEMITSLTYGEERFYLVQETNMDLNALKQMAESVIPFGDCTYNDSLNPMNETDLSEIINNVAFNLPGHGGDYTETIYNPDLSKEVEKFGVSGEKLINKLFSEIAERYDIPFNE